MFRELIRVHFGEDYDFDSFETCSQDKIKKYSSSTWQERVTDSFIERISYITLGPSTGNPNSDTGLFFYYIMLPEEKTN